MASVYRWEPDARCSLGSGNSPGGTPCQRGLGRRFDVGLVKDTVLTVSELGARAAGLATGLGMPPNLPVPTVIWSKNYMDVYPRSHVTSGRVIPQD